MIKEYLLCMAFVSFLVYKEYKAPPPPLTAAQIQQKGKERKKAEICARLKRGIKYDRLCGNRGAYAFH
jgi:hypothetical protein